MTVEFSADDVEVPEGFVPEEAILQERSTFERLLSAIEDAGVEKQSAVAEINALQADLGVTVEAAAVVYARRRGVDVAADAERAIGDL